MGDVEGDGPDGFIPAPVTPLSTFGSPWTLRTSSCLEAVAGSGRRKPATPNAGPTCRAPPARWTGGSIPFTTSLARGGGPGEANGTAGLESVRAEGLHNRRHFSEPRYFPAGRKERSLIWLEKLLVANGSGRGRRPIPPFPRTDPGFGRRLSQFADGRAGLRVRQVYLDADHYKQANAVLMPLISARSARRPEF